ncbi:MAG: hypothetical protein MUE51_15610 [Thermoleophilia bacterium]|jgi:hypothetical protein|nr:hypothetical protein [Thermoleophilia bacterium]
MVEVRVDVRHGQRAWWRLMRLPAVPERGDNVALPGGGRGQVESRLFVDGAPAHVRVEPVGPLSERLRALEEAGWAVDEDPVHY